MLFRRVESAILPFAPKRSASTDTDAKYVRSILAKFMESGDMNSLKFITASRLAASHHRSEQQTLRPIWWSFVPTAIE
jgi:hypothetical protein